MPSYSYQFLCLAHSWRTRPNAHTLFRFKTNPSWREFYAPGADILAYLRSTAAELDFEAKVKLNHKVTRCDWNEDAGKWTVEITDTRSGAVSHDVCDLLVNGGGVLNAWKWPEVRVRFGASEDPLTTTQIAGREDFEGKLLHSASWDTSVDCTGKRIAVIGSGSSGIQIVPEMAKIASQVTSFNRYARHHCPELISTSYVALAPGSSPVSPPI